MTKFAEEMIRAMSQGNTDTYQCLTEMLDIDEPALTFACLALHWKITAEEIPVLWRDCCNSDTDTFNRTMQYFLECKLSEEAIHEHLSHVPAEPFI